MAKRRAEDGGDAAVKRAKEAADAPPAASKFTEDAQQKVAENFGDEVHLKAKRQRDLAAVVNSDDEDDENPDAEKALDSDDEEVVEKEEAGDVGARRLNTHKIKKDKFEGETETHVDHEEGQQFTAFNLNEEKEEGRFDKYGNYERVYEKEQTHDAWADSVEWNKNQLAETLLKKREKKEAEEAARENENFDEVTALQTIVGFMCPKETVLQALRRLGAAGAPKPGWKTKKDKKKAAAAAAANEGTTEVKDKEAQAKSFAGLTTAADNLLRSGHVTVYEDTYEKLAFLLKSKEQDKAEGKREVVMWEYRVENKPESELYGPFTSQQMHDWQTQGSLSNGCWCRRILDNGDRTNFYDSKRVEFDDWL